MTFDITQEQTARKENFKQRLCLKVGDRVKIPASEKQGFLIAIVEKIYKHYAKIYKHYAVVNTGKYKTTVKLINGKAVK